jgi:hypothetical protein
LEDNMTRELGEILSGDEPAQAAEPIVETPATEPTTEPTVEQPRGPDGKFAPKATEPEAPAAVEPQAEPAPKTGTVPQQALHAAREKERQERDRADDLARQLAELNGKVSILTQQREAATPPPEPPKPVDFWDDPNKFVEQALTPVQQALAETRFELSQTRALAKYGEEAIETASVALKEAIERGEENGAEWAQKLRSSRDPVGDVVRRHQNSPAVRDAELREKIRAELLAELGTQQPIAEPTPAASIPEVMPSNLAGARNVGNRSGPAYAGPAPLNDIFDRSRPKKAG